MTHSRERIAQSFSLFVPNLSGGLWVREKPQQPRSKGREQESLLSWLFLDLLVCLFVCLFCLVGESYIQDPKHESSTPARCTPRRTMLEEEWLRVHVPRVRAGVVWFGLVWFGLVWFGLVWFGLVWFGLVWFGLVWFGLVWFGLVWFGRMKTRSASFVPPYHHDDGSATRTIATKHTESAEPQFHPLHSIPIIGFEQTNQQTNRYLLQPHTSQPTVWERATLVDGCARHIVVRGKQQPQQ